MKKLILSTLLLPSLFIINSCKKEDATPAKNNLELLTSGKWQIESIVIFYTDSTSEPLKLTLEECESDYTLNFDKNTNVISNENPIKCDSSETSYETSIFHLSEDQRSYTTEDTEIVFNILHLSPTKLAISIDEAEGLDISSYLFIYKKI